MKPRHVRNFLLVAEEKDFGAAPAPPSDTASSVPAHQTFETVPKGTAGGEYQPAGAVRPAGVTLSSIEKDPDRED
jgi:hypothetical protein